MIRAYVRRFVDISFLIAFLFMVVSPIFMLHSEIFMYYLAVLCALLIAAILII